MYIYIYIYIRTYTYRYVSICIYIYIMCTNTLDTCVWYSNYINMFNMHNYFKMIMRLNVISLELVWAIARFPDPARFGARKPTDAKTACLAVSGAPETSTRGQGSDSVRRRRIYLSLNKIQSVHWLTCLQVVPKYIMCLYV